MLESSQNGRFWITTEDDRNADVKAQKAYLMAWTVESQRSLGSHGARPLPLTRHVVPVVLLDIVPHYEPWKPPRPS